MKLFTRSFECENNLSLEQCKAKILANYPKRRVFAWSNILLDSFSEEPDSFSFSLMQSRTRRTRGFCIIMDADVTRQNSTVHITGDVHVATITVLIFSWILMITPILSLVFRPVPFLSVFLLLVFAESVLFTINGLRRRQHLIHSVCNLLSNSDCTTAAQNSE